MEIAVDMIRDQANRHQQEDSAAGLDVGCWFKSNSSRQPALNPNTMKPALIKMLCSFECCIYPSTGPLRGPKRLTCLRRAAVADSAWSDRGQNSHFLMNTDASLMQCARYERAVGIISHFIDAREVGADCMSSADSTE